MISHLLFVDDKLIFCKPEVDQLGYLRCILVLFEMMLGLKINLSKSVLIPIGEVYPCGVDYLPSSYLGLPLGASYKCKAV